MATASASRPCYGGRVANVRHPIRRMLLPPNAVGAADVARPADRHVNAVQAARADQVGPPFQIGRGAEPAADDQRLAAVAFDGTNYLVVWEDRRTGSTDLYCARMTPDGEVLDPNGIVIAAERNAQGTPAVAFDGMNYLVVWDDWRFSMNPNIYGARVTTGGVVLDTTAIPVSTAVDGQTNPAIAFDGTNYLVAWEDWRAGTLAPDIYCTRVSPSGSVLDTAGVVVSAAAEDQTRPAVAFNGTDYVVVWEDTRVAGLDIYGARVSQAATVLDPGGIAVSTATWTQQYPSVACDGSNCLVVWEDMRSDYNGDVYGARISPAGAVLDPVGLPISPAESYQLRPSLVFVQGTYFVAWEDWRSDSAEVYGVRLNSDGTVFDNIGMILPAPGVWYTGDLDLALGCDGGVVLGVWTEWEGSLSEVTDVFGARVSIAGDVLEPGVIRISADPRTEEFPAIAFDGTNHLVVWGSQGSGYSSEIRGRRVKNDGTVLDQRILVSSSANDFVAAPTVAFGGKDYLVAWGGYRDNWGGLYAARVDTSGTVRDSACITVCTEGGVTDFAAVAFDGRNYFVVWEDYRGEGLDLYGARIDTSGAVLDPGGFPIATGTGWQELPAVAFDGTNYLVVWDDNRSRHYEVYAARVDTSGTVLDPGGVVLPTSTIDNWAPAVAFDGTQYLVAWMGAEAEGYSIYGSRVSKSGLMLDPGGIQLSDTTGRHFFPAVGFDGVSFLVTWTLCQSPSDTLLDVYGTCVSTSGTVSSPGGAYVGGAGLWSYDAGFPPRSTVSRGPTHSLLIAYPALTPAPYLCNRIWGNIWSGPSALTFASVTASGQGGRVTLSWQMGIDAPASSFEVWRSDSQEGEFLRLELNVVQDGASAFRCIDEAVSSGRTYWYRIVLTGLAGGESYGPVGVFVEAAPLAFKLAPAFPNPFNPTCTIRYDVPVAGRVSLRVFDVGGRIVRTLADAWREPGVYAEVWDGRSDGGDCLSSGVYVCLMKTGTFTASQKAVLLR